MKNKLFTIFLLLTVTVALPALEAKSTANQDQKNQMQGHQLEGSKIALSEVPTGNPIINGKVDGMVCSFCAYGIENKLSNLPFVETTAFGGDGVKVDLKNGIISVTLKDAKKLNFGAIVESVIKGGYVAREIHLTINGIVQKDGAHTIIQESEFPYHFILNNSEGKSFGTNRIGQAIKVSAFFNVPSKFNDKKKISVTVKEEI